MNKPIIKTNDEVKIIREASKRLAWVVANVTDNVKEGITTKELDDIAFGLIDEMGDKPAFLNYKPEPSARPYPSTICTSVNEIVVHGIPSDTVLKNGDIITIDCGIEHNGYFSDHAVSVVVGDNKDAFDILNVTRNALYEGISVVRDGTRINEIGAAIEEYIKGRYGIIKDYAGHGVGKYIHEPPLILNYKNNINLKMKKNMVFAIEPMLADIKNPKTRILSDGYSVEVLGARHTCMFEHTVLVTDDGFEILTEI